MNSKTMKKLMALLMAAAMMLSLAACSKDEPKNEGNDTPGVSDGDKKDDNKEADKKEADKKDEDKKDEGGEALSEEDYKAKITEIGNKVAELTNDVNAAQTKASTDPEGAINDLIDIVAEMKPLYQELADLKAPEKFVEAQKKIKSGCEASVEMLDLTVEMMELAVDPEQADKAQEKLTELTEKMTEYQADAQTLTEGLQEVMQG